jgi:hypothetical protein
MNRIAFSLLALFILIGFADAQDQLFKTDNTRLLVKILEVGTEEIKYKRFDNLSGPTYLESKKNVSVIIYENGQHQVFTPSSTLPSETPVPGPNNTVIVPKLEVFDSLTYYRYSNSISINFLNFFNNEVGVIYRREFFRNQFNIILPFAFGVSRPAVTQTFFFNNNNQRVELLSKRFEVGFGIHYYPSLKTKVNYYIGPVFRHMQYDCHQEVTTMSWPSYLVAENNTILSRNAFSITNGLIYRTRSRLTTNMFISVGFKNDVVADPLRDNGGNVISTMNNPLGFYWWSGFEVGFSF